jgi:hypothetical protein
MHREFGETLVSVRIGCPVWGSRTLPLQRVVVIIIPWWHQHGLPSHRRAWLAVVIGKRTLSLPGMLLATALVSSAYIHPRQTS